MIVTIVVAAFSYPVDQGLPEWVGIVVTMLTCYAFVDDDPKPPDDDSYQI